jgi:hypothetical protein
MEVPYHRAVLLWKAESVWRNVVARNKRARRTAVRVRMPSLINRLEHDRSSADHLGAIEVSLAERDRNARSQLIRPVRSADSV